MTDRIFFIKSYKYVLIQTEQSKFVPTSPPFPKLIFRFRGFIYFFFKRPDLLEGVRQGDNLRFRGLRLFKKTLSILEGVRQGEYSTFFFFSFFAHSSKAD